MFATGKTLFALGKKQDARGGMYDGEGGVMSILIESEDERRWLRGGSGGGSIDSSGDYAWRGGMVVPEMRQWMNGLAVSERETSRREQMGRADNEGWHDGVDIIKIQMWDVDDVRSE